jgi:hypothetical protein
MDQTSNFVIDQQYFLIHDLIILASIFILHDRAEDTSTYSFMDLSADTFPAEGKLFLQRLIFLVLLDRPFRLKSKKKIRVGADQTFQLAIREISINRCQF